MYTAFKQLDNGDFLEITVVDQLVQAARLIEALKVHWPGNYVVRDSEGNDMELPPV